MSDLLVKLYELPPAPALPDGVLIRKPLGPEHGVLGDWVAGHFGAAWASEARAALGNRPVSLYMALLAGVPVGFACYDATARGYFGPIGVLAAAQRQGLGAGLLSACLADMLAVGYGYAVIGGVGPTDFFRRAVGAVEIPGSSPGLYRGMLKAGSVMVPRSEAD